MGGSISTPFGSPNKAQTQAILNTILREMFRRADLVDLYSLADSERCKSYIVVAQTALDKLFVKLNLEPKKGKDGIFYFQKIEGIQKANPAPALQQQTCKELAFFFIRVFQVFAALTISVLDSDLPELDPVEIAKPTNKQVIFINPPSVQGFPQPKRGLFSMRGGALKTGTTFYLEPDLAGPYKLLNQFLLHPKDVNDITKEMKFNDLNMYIPQRELYTFNSPTGAPTGASREVKDFEDASTPRPQVLYNYIYLDQQYPLSGQLFLVQTENGIDVTLKNVQSPSKAPGKNIPAIEGKLINRLPGDENPMTDPGKTLPYLLMDLFGRAFETLIKPDFSMVNFLKRLNLIDTLEQPTLIKDSNVILNTKPRDQMRASRLPILYKETMKIDGKQTEVKVNVEMVISRLSRDNTTEPQKYKVRVQFNNLTITPGELKSAIRYPNAMEQIFSTGLTDNNVPSTEKGTKLPEWLNRVFAAILKDVRDTEEGVLMSRGGIKFTREGFPKPYDSDAVPDALKVKQIWEGLARNPPLKTHCTARALQLLSIAAIRGDMSKEAFSSVCNMKFPYVQDGSLPRPGTSVTSEVGLLALAKLFVDDIVAGAPRITEAAQWRTFSSRLRSFFERYETIQADLPPPERLSDIQDLKMPYCRGNESGRIMLTPALAKALRAKALALISREGPHLRNVMRLMFKLFDESKIRTGTLEIHPNVMAGGIEYVNKLAREAREVLIEYYGDCEKMYKEGLFLLYDASRKETLTFRATNSRGMPIVSAGTSGAPGAATERANSNNNNDLAKLGNVS